MVDAQRRLAETGTFEEGVYTFPSGRKRDAYEAILEELTGERIEYPKPRLNSYIVLRSSGMPWRPHAALPGVEAKDLAYFFDCGPNIKMARIAAGSALPGATPAGHRAVFLLEGDLSFGGAAYDTLSYFILPGGEEHPTLEAVSDATLLTIGWSPTGDKVPFDLF